MVKIKKIQTLLGKNVDINLLKGVKFIDFKKQNRITKIVAKEFSQAKSKDIMISKKYLMRKNVQEHYF